MFDPLMTSAIYFAFGLDLEGSWTRKQVMRRLGIGNCHVLQDSKPTSVTILGSAGRWRPWNYSLSFISHIANILHLPYICRKSGTPKLR